MDTNPTDLHTSPCARCDGGEVLADLNALFSERHALAQTTVTSPDGYVHVFAEEVMDGGARLAVSLTDRARKLDEPHRLRPARARGIIVVTSPEHFVNLVADAGESPSLVGVSNAITAYDKPAQAVTAILNPTLPDGTPGHGDHYIRLQADPAPAGAAWLAAALSGKPLSIQQFQNLIYGAGAVVVPPSSWPAETSALMKRLGLDGKTGLADLLVASPGVEIEGQAEMGETVDAHTGAVTSRLKAPNKPRAAIPTAVVIEWEPVPGLTEAVALRLFVRKAADGNGFDWHLQPIDLAERARAAAVHLHQRLRAELGPQARVFLGPATA